MKKSFDRILASLLCVMMLFACVPPMTAHAAGNSGTNYSFPDVDHDQVCFSTAKNARAAIMAIQYFEGQLNEVHDILQRMCELAVKRENATNTGINIEYCNAEIAQLIDEINSVYDTSSFDGFYFLRQQGSVMRIPMACPDKCHHEMSIASLGRPSLSVDVTSTDLDAVIAQVSRQRADLGALHNALEHILDISQAIAAYGPGAAPEFETGPDGHHAPKSELKGYFKASWDAIDKRVAELNTKRANSTNDNFDIEAIDKELARLDEARDVIADLLCEKTVLGYYTISNSMDVQTQIWTDDSTVPDGPKDSLYWQHDYDAAVGSTLYYRIIVTPGMLKTGDVSHNLILSNLVSRITVDYDSLKVWYEGMELQEGVDYRLYENDYREFSDNMDPEQSDAVAELMALRNRIQHSYDVYHTFGLIFDNSLCNNFTEIGEMIVDMSRANSNWTPQGVLQLLRMVVQHNITAGIMSKQFGIPTNYVYEPIIVTFRARLDDNAYLTGGDAAGHSINAKGAPTYLVSQGLTSTIGWTDVSEDEYMSWVHGEGPDELPRYAKARGVNIEALERDGFIDNSNQLAGETDSYTLYDAATVYNYGFDLAKTDEDGKLLENAVFEVRKIPGSDSDRMVVNRYDAAAGVVWTQGVLSLLASEDPDAVPDEPKAVKLEDCPVVEFVKTDMKGFSAQFPTGHPEGPVYRVATDADPAGTRVSEVTAGDTALIGMDSGAYFVVEKRAPNGYDIVDPVHTVKLLSIRDLIARFVTIAESQIRDTDMATEMTKYDKNNVLQQAAQSMLAQANQNPGGVLGLLGDEDAATENTTYAQSQIRGLDQTGSNASTSKNLEKLSSGYRINRAADSAAGLAISEKMRAQLNGMRQAWKNLTPIQVDGEGYDLSEYGYPEKCVPAWALFHKVDGEWVYGGTHRPDGEGDLVLQIGANADMKLVGSEENPIYGGARVVNKEAFHLPYTGGEGTAAYYMAGTGALALVGALVLLRIRRKRGE